MTTRSQLEASIAAALSHLPEADMQRVAEDYARIRFPDRFPRFDFRALSPEGRSRAGWPDAWINLDGHLDGVEATCAKKKRAVERHLEDYLKKAQQCEPQLAGFLHVSGHPAVQMSHDEITTWRRRFIDEACIDPNRLDLVFGAGLIEALVRPEFARTRIELLGLPDKPKHFKLAGAKRGPDEGRLNKAFVPSDEDYAGGRVHRPAMADQVVDRLATDGCVLIRGVGASGKSVLAWLLALEFAENRKPAYILDIAAYANALPSSSNELIEDLHRFSHPHSLFILDNCHLNEPLAKEVVLAWQELVANEQPRLLLLGRELRTSRGSLIDGLGIQPLPLRAREPELLGVYRRLAWHRCSNAMIPEPPANILKDWVAEFGGDPRSPDTTTDLIAFSAATVCRMDELLRGNWSLSADDAIDEIRTVYLHPSKLSEQELRNLIRLCAVEELELPLPQDALAEPRAGLDRCNREHGLVFRQAAGKSGQHILYRLAHAALGELILQAIQEPADRSAERITVAIQSPFTAAFIIARLRATGCFEEAQKLASEIMRQPELLLKLPSLSYVRTTLRQVQTVGISLSETLGDSLVGGSKGSRVMEMALLTPLNDLANFLGYAAKTDELKPVFALLARDFTLPKNLNRLSRQALVTPLGDLANFLGYTARIDVLRPVFVTLARNLALPENLEGLSKQAIRTHFHFLANFLDFAAKADELKPVFSTLARDLTLPKNLDRLSEQAMVTPLGDLANFLGHTARTDVLKPVFRRLARDLALPANLERLSKRAVLTPLQSLASFLNYTATTDQLKPVFTSLAIGLALPENQGQLTKRALLTPLGDLSTFLSCAAKTDELKSAFTALARDLGLPENLEQLVKQALLTPLGGLSTFFDYSAKTDALKAVSRGLANELGRPGNIGQLSEQALLTPLDQLATFLDCAAKSDELKSVLADLTKNLAEAENCSCLGKSMCRQPLDAVVSALISDSAPDLWDAVLASINITEWANSRRLEQNPKLDAYVAFNRIALQRNRSELSQAPARRIVSASTPEDWHRPGIGLHHLSHILRMARVTPMSDLEIFLDRIATPKWVDGLVDKVATGSLAGTLFALALTLDPNNRRWFIRDSTTKRVSRELSRLPTSDIEARAATLSLLGAAAAIGINADTKNAHWPEDRELAEVVELRAPVTGLTTIGHLQAQLWLGLREMAKTRAESAKVPPRLADLILDLWIATQKRDAGDELLPHVYDINTAMIAWLLRCKAAGWNLLAP
jgi:hypothetical protein